jgi:arylsulfatase A-like enzyme
VILTADHGGQAKEHGTREACDMTIPWIAAGPRVTHKGVLTRPVRTVDTALTVLSLLGLPAPADVAGKAVAEALGTQ